MICQVFGFIYFELNKSETVSFNVIFQTYGIYRNIVNSTTALTTSLLIMCFNRKQL